MIGAARPQFLPAAPRPRRLWCRWLAVTLSFFVLYYVALLALTILRFREIPNYVEFYDVVGSYRQILRGTPAWTDALQIILDEPLFETGFKDPSYYGVATWSYLLIPAKMAVVLFAGAMLATVAALATTLEEAACPAFRRPTYALAGLGTGLVGLTSATLTWVACCATPSWVVGLTMLGMSSSLALWLDPVGAILTMVGFVVLGGLVAWQWRRLTASAAPAGDQPSAIVPVSVPEVPQRRGAVR